MIQCPICNQMVLDPTDKKTIPDMSDEDFYCPTYVEVARMRRWCHYQRRTYTQPEVESTTPYSIYTAIVAPFKIVWHSDNKMMVDKFIFAAPDDASSIRYELILLNKETEFQEFLRTIKRVQNLVIFS